MLDPNPNLQATEVSLSGVTEVTAHKATTTLTCTQFPPQPPPSPRASRWRRRAWRCWRSTSPRRPCAYVPCHTVPGAGAAVLALLHTKEVKCFQYIKQFTFDLFMMVATLTHHFNCNF